MSKVPKSESQRPVPRLYLVTPEVDDAPAFAQTLSDVLGAADIAAVLLRLKAADERTQINRIKTLVGAVQRTETALVLDGNPQMVARGGADGAHLTGFDDFMATVAVSSRVASRDAADSIRETMR